jgi:ABC-type hemin transport system, ATPase component
MAPFAERLFPTLSGGEQTRASLARVLAQQAPLVLLDEPTAALDLRHQHAALRLARALAASGGAAVIVLHDLNLAAGYADRIGILHEGRLVAIGAPWDVLRPELLSAVYGIPIVVHPHPHTGAPLLLTLPDVPSSGQGGVYEVLEA